MLQPADLGKICAFHAAGGAAPLIWRAVADIVGRMLRLPAQWPVSNRVEPRRKIALWGLAPGLHWNVWANPTSPASGASSLWGRVALRCSRDACANPCACAAGAAMRCGQPALQAMRALRRAPCAARRAAVHCVPFGALRFAAFRCGSRRGLLRAAVLRLDAQKTYPSR